MVIRVLTYQLHKLEASESALVSADHHDKKSVLGIGGKNPDRSIPISLYILRVFKLECSLNVKHCYEFIVAYSYLQNS